MKKKLLSVILSLITLAILPATAALAISNPTSIAFGTGTSTNRYNVFQNILETGDVLIAAETLVAYASDPTDYTSQEAFNLELLDTTGTTVLFSSTIKKYGGGVNAIYLSASQVTANFTWGTAYILRIAGNPSIFGALVEGTNKVTKTLQASDYINDTPAGTSLSGLRSFMITTAENLQTYDGVTTYTTTNAAVTYITPTGSNIFNAGVPGLSGMIPTLFSVSAGVFQYTDPAHGGAYAANRTIASSWNTGISNGITTLGSYLGVSDTLAGGLVAFIVIIIGLGYVTVKGMGRPAMAVCGTLLVFVCTYLGLIPMAFIFAVLTLIVVYGVYHLITRGAL